MSKCKDIEFTIVSGRELDIDIETVNEDLAKISTCQGGIRWLHVKNYWLLGKFLWQRGLFSLLYKEKYDAVIFLGNVYFVSSWLCACFCRFNNIPVLMWGHGYLRHEKGIKGFVRALFYKLGDVHFIYSKRSVDLMIKHGLGSKKLMQINNSLDYFQQLDIRNDLVRNNPIDKKNKLLQFRLIFIGRLTPQKNLKILIIALKNLKDLGLDIYLDIIGDGKEKEVLLNLSNSLEVSNYVNYLGAIYDDKLISKYIYNADLCVSPGEVGLTAIHSMMFGTPVITHNNFDYQMPEYEAINPGLTGNFYNYNSVESLTDVIYNWLKLYSNKREIIRKACFEMIDNKYTPKYQKKIFLQGIYNVLKKC